MKTNLLGYAKPVAASAVFITLALGVVNPANAIYLNEQNITISLGSSMAPNPFANRTTAASLASIIDAPSASASENHDQSTHVWVSGGSLELDFDFGMEYDLTALHFWNYFGEGFDVDNIDFTFFDASKSLVGSLLNVMPQLGGAGGNPIFAEDIFLSFPSNIQFVNAVLTGSNNQVDFNNIGFTGQISTGGGGSTPIPEPGILSLLVIGGLGFAARKWKMR